MTEKTLVAMSGGVDSSVAALLLKESGCDCVGVTMRLFCNSSDSCANPDESGDAAAVANAIGIPFRLVDYQKDFKEKVIGYFIDSYLNGETPNPCVECNRVMKFGKLFEVADALGCSKIATGHYARIDYQNGRYLLKKALEPAKDQSYVLWSLTQEQLARISFPLGGYSKEKIREIAEKNALCTAKKKDSQDICFIPDGDYVKFIEEQTKITFREGLFIDLQGNPIGKHTGAIHYTMGQRKGLGMGFGKPVYVCKKDMKANTVTLGNNEDLFSNELTAKNVNLISVDKIHEPIRLTAKIRYAAKPSLATVYPIDDTRLKVVFDEPQRAISKGQSVVFYDGDYVFGGGIIE